jgi:mono/diheme cytochrome c family protein
MIRAVMKRRLLPTLLLVVAAAALLSACGSQGVSVPGATASVKNGAKLFSARCSGCHTFAPAGTQGSATKVTDREKTDGPNFNVRRVCYDNALYALRNGGYSGAIMPENIVVGKQAQDVAAFVAAYSGKQASHAASPTGPAVRCPPLPPGVGQ